MDMKTSGWNTFILEISYYTTEVYHAGWHYQPAMGWPWLVCFEGMIRTDTAGPIGRIWAEYEGKKQYLKVGKVQNFSKV